MKFRTEKLHANMDGEKIDFYQVSIEVNDNLIILCTTDDKDIAELVCASVSFYLDFHFGLPERMIKQGSRIAWLDNQDADYSVTGFLQVGKVA